MASIKGSPILVKNWATQQLSHGKNWTANQAAKSIRFANRTWTVITKIPTNVKNLVVKSVVSVANLGKNTLLGIANLTLDSIEGTYNFAAFVVSKSERSSEVYEERDSLNKDFQRISDPKIEQLVHLHLKGGSALSQVQTVPTNLPVEKPNGHGIGNFGNSCFANSALQAFKHSNLRGVIEGKELSKHTHLETIRNAYGQVVYDKENQPQHKTVVESDEQFELRCKIHQEIKRLFIVTDTNSFPHEETRALRQMISEYLTLSDGWDKFPLAEQSDAGEFAIALFDILDLAEASILTKHHYTGGLQEDFDPVDKGGRAIPRVMYEVSTDSIAQVSMGNPQEGPGNLQLQDVVVSNISSVQTSESPITSGPWGGEEGALIPNKFDYKNGKKFPNNEETRSLFVSLDDEPLSESALPATMPFVLKRLQYNGQVDRRPVSSCEYIDVPIMTAGIDKTREGWQTKIDGVKDSGKKARYKLRSVTVHKGSAFGGHYECLVREDETMIRDGKPYRKEAWTNYNDGSAYKVNPNPRITTDGILYMFDLVGIIDSK